MRRPDSGPSISATAMARFSSTTGEPVSSASRPRAPRSAPNRKALRRAGRRSPLCHRLLGHEEGTCDLVCREPAEGAERERHLRLDGQGRVAAREDELQALVRERCRVHGCLSGSAGGEEAGFRRQGPLAADGVRCSIPGRRHQPGAWIAGHAVARPAMGGDGERLLRGFLGQVKVAEEADQGGQDAAHSSRKMRSSVATNTPRRVESRQRHRSVPPGRGRPPRWRRRGRRLRG